MPTPEGMPIWYELLTADLDAARRFYGPITGWTTTAFPTPGGGMEYNVWTMADTGIGGLASPPPGAAVPSGWLAYFHVQDVDAKAKAVAAAGGAITMPASDIPGVGRIALVADPQGVPFYLMRPDPSMPDVENTSFSEHLPGRAAWNELVTSDQGASLPFYAGLFGWSSTEAMPMGEMGDYSFIDGPGGIRLGAMMNRAHPEQPLRWAFYFRVPDADRAAEQVKAGGGQVVAGPMDVPGGQRVVMAIDPQGAGVGFVAGERA